MTDPTDDTAAPAPDLWGAPPEPEAAPEPAPEPVAEPEVLNLPAPIGTPDHLAVDVETLEGLLPTLRRDLVTGIRQSATAYRRARGRVVAPEDTYDLVRRLVRGGEVLRQVAAAFTAGAAEADAQAEEEALIALGEQDGVPNSSHFVPDGQGQRIAIRAKFAAGSSSWDMATLRGWLVESTVERIAAEVEPDGKWGRGDAELAARLAVEQLLAIGTYSPKVTEVEKLRVAAAERGDDETAKILGQLRTVGDRTYKGVEVSREAAPKGRAK